MAAARRSVMGEVALRRIPAMAWLTATALGSAGVATLILLRHPAAAGGVAGAAAALLLAGGARAARFGTTRDRLADLLADRVFDASVLVPLAWIERGPSEPAAALALVGFGTSFVASYERARGAALGYPGSEGLGYRAARDVLLVAALLSARPVPFLAAFVVVTATAALVRAWNVARQDRGGAVRDAP